MISKYLTIKAHQREVEHAQYDTFIPNVHQDCRGKFASAPVWTWLYLVVCRPNFSGLKPRIGPAANGPRSLDGVWASQS